MQARFHHLVWIGAAALVGVAACGGNAGKEKPTGAAPGGPGATPASECLGAAWFGGLDEGARARVIDLVCADARSGTLSEKRLTGEAGPSCKGTYNAQSDEQINAVLTALNDGQMRQANLAETNANQAPVRDFAHMISTASARSGEEQKAMMRRTKARSQDDELSRALVKGFDDVQVSLRAARGPNFDREFMSRSIIQHARTLEMLDEIAPQTKNEDVRCTVDRNRDLTQAHLQLACTIYGNMPATTPAATPPATMQPPPAQTQPVVEVPVIVTPVEKEPAKTTETPTPATTTETTAPADPPAAPADPPAAPADPPANPADPPAAPADPPADP